MTNGTKDLMEKIMIKHENLTIHLMNSAASTLAYYEDDKKSIFKAGRAYEIIVQNGNIEEEGYVVMNNIPLSEEGIPVFEYRFKKRQKDLNTVEGFQAFRLLKPQKGNTYVVLTQWATEEDYEAWKDSDNFTKAHQNQAIKPPAYFTERPFITAYSMGDEEEEEENEENLVDQEETKDE